MKFTVRTLIEPLGNEARLDLVCRTFSSMVRTTYNQILEGKQTNKIVNILKTRYGIENWRWCQWAILQAQTTINSQRELLPLYVEMYAEKIARVRRKMTHADSRKKTGYLARIRKLERQKARVEKHVEAGTVPPAVFGSCRLLEKTLKDNVLREEWRRRRANQFFSVGQANCGGNANTRIKRDYMLEVRN